jgi:hypothetical protein
MLAPGSDHALEPVVPSGRRRLVCEPGAVQRPEQPVAGQVAGEDAAGAVAAVRGRGEPDDQQRRVHRAESRYRPAPVLLVRERGPLLACDALAPLHEPRTPAAADDAPLELG